MPGRLPLPVRRSVALMTEAAYARPRALNARYGLGNNYLLVVLPGRPDDYSDRDRLDAVLDDFIQEYSAPDARQGDQNG